MSRSRIAMPPSMLPAYPAGPIAAHACGRSAHARASTAVLLRRDVLVEPEDVVGVVLGLDGRQPVPRRARVGGANPLLAFVADEAGVRAGVAVVERGRKV